MVPRRRQATVVAHPIWRQGGAGRREGRQSELLRRRRNEPAWRPPRLVLYLAGGHRIEFEADDAVRLWAAVSAIAPDVRTELKTP